MGNIYTEDKKEGINMNLQNKQVLSAFIYKDRFELNFYLTYLLNEFKDFPKQLEDRDNNQRDKTK